MPWTADELATLVQLRRDGASAQQVADHLGRTRLAVRVKITQLQATYAVNHGRWTLAEVEQLRARQAQGLKPIEIAQHITGRSPHAIRVKIAKMAAAAREAPPRQAWSPEDVEALIELRGRGATLTEIGQKLNRSRASVKRKVASLPAATSPRSQRPWTDREIEHLVELRRAGRTRAEIAEALNRTVRSVRHQLILNPITHRCPTCRRERPANEFGWSPLSRTPPCRSCVSQPVTVAPVRPVKPSPRVEPPIDINVDREGRIRQLTAQFEHQGVQSGRWDTSRYTWPTEQDWHAAWTRRPEDMARIIRDIVLEQWWADHDQPGRLGRRPHITLKGTDIVSYLPDKFARALLPDAWPD